MGVRSAAADRIDGVIARLPDGRTIHGSVAPGYEALVDTFVGNFAGHQELGAATVVYRDGEAVVDLWAGVADRRIGRAWDRDTSAVIFSCTKGIVAILAYSLRDRGLLDLDAPIIRYWPAFGQAGKSAITVRDALSHRSGLASLDVALSRDEALDWRTVVEAIERQAPHNDPATGHDYHGMTYGWIVGEVIRRITGLRPGELLQREVAGPRGLDVWIGLPAGKARSVAWMEPPLPDEDSEAARAAAALVDGNADIDRAFTMGGAWGFPVEDDGVSFNDPAIQRAEVPGANGIATARSLAQLYGDCVAPAGGPPLLTTGSVRDALVVRSAGQMLWGLPDDGARWGTGFQLSSPPSQPMLGDHSFGHAGAGGQLAFADAQHRIGFAYLGNQMGGYGDQRARRLTESLRQILADS